MGEKMKNGVSKDLRTTKIFVARVFVARVLLFRGFFWNRLQLTATRKNKSRHLLRG
jgi:hypothetical protein